MTKVDGMASGQGRRKFTDEQLREALLKGVTPADFARQVGVSRQAVNLRVKQLELSTVAAAQVQPEESRRYVRETIDAWEQLSRGLRRVNLLMDACDEWLKDAQDPERYDVGPRTGEVDITYEVEIETETPKGEPRFRTEKRKKKLSELMATLEGYDEDGARYCGWKKGETKHADPRELILKTANEARQTVNTAAELARMLADARAMEALREAIIAEVTKVDSDAGARIAAAVRRSILLNAALGGPGALPAGAAGAEPLPG